MATVIQIDWLTPSRLTSPNSPLLFWLHCRPPYFAIAQVRGGLAPAMSEFLEADMSTNHESNTASHVSQVPILPPATSALLCPFDEPFRYQPESISSPYLFERRSHLFHFNNLYKLFALSVLLITQPPEFDRFSRSDACLSYWAYRLSSSDILFVLSCSPDTAWLSLHWSRRQSDRIWC